MDLKIIFENSQYMVVNKPAGLVVNRSQTVRGETLQDQLSDYLGLTDGDLGIGDRVGIVHRLDRETSGLLTVAKTKAAFDFLQKEFAARRVKKEYLALVHGEMAQSEGTIEISIARVGKFAPVRRRQQGGRETQTSFSLLDRLSFKDDQFEKILEKGQLNKIRVNYLKKHAQKYSYLKVVPKTGRTHQIRVALKSIGCPVVSDLIYVPSKLIKFDLAWCPRLFLHATFLEFWDPASGRRVSFTSALPGDLESAKLYLEPLHTRIG